MSANRALTGGGVHKWSKPALKPAFVAVLLAACVGVFQFIPRPQTGVNSSDPASRQKRFALEHCREAAYLIYDLHWASACMVLAEEAEARRAACLRNPAIVGDRQLKSDYCEEKFPVSDDSADCTLPDWRAKSVNTLLKTDEKSCVAQAGTAVAR